MSQTLFVVAVNGSVTNDFKRKAFKTVNSVRHILKITQTKISKINAGSKMIFFCCGTRFRFIIFSLKNINQLKKDKT